MRAGVIDVGSNTIRLLVADARAGRLEVVLERRAWVRLGVDVARTGQISTRRLDVAAAAVATFAADARRLGCAWIEVLIASPGRQAANADDLVRALEVAAATLVRVLEREEEARLAYYGATDSLGELSGTVAVCDVGGGSTQIGVGLPEQGPLWLRSLDIGSLRLTAEAIEREPLGKKAVARARELACRQFEDLSPPRTDVALAVGGSARAIRRVVGSSLGEDELQEAIAILRKRSPRDIAAAFSMPRDRARTLLAGAVILSEAQRCLSVSLRVVSGGLREGAVYELASQAAAA